jgi:hypothetical protein
VRYLLLIGMLAALVIGCAGGGPHYNRHVVIMPDGAYCTDNPTVLGPPAKKQYRLPAESGSLFDRMRR